MKRSAATEKWVEVQDMIERWRTGDHFQFLDLPDSAGAKSARRWSSSTRMRPGDVSAGADLVASIPTPPLDQRSASASLAQNSDVPVGRRDRGGKGQDAGRIRKDCSLGQSARALGRMEKLSASAEQIRVALQCAVTDSPPDRAVAASPVMPPSSKVQDEAHGLSGEKSALWMESTPRYSLVDVGDEPAIVDTARESAPSESDALAAVGIGTLNEDGWDTSEIIQMSFREVSVELSRT